MVRRSNTTKTEKTSATVGYDAQLWQIADALRGSMDAADWGGESLREDKRWKYGVPPARNANFACVQEEVSSR